MIVVSGEDSVLQLTVTGKECEEFKQLINRATNTWDTVPNWVRVVSDTLNNVPNTEHF